MAASSIPNWQKPQTALTVNGTQVMNAIVGMDVDNNNFFAADTFKAEVALNLLPASLNAAFWSDSEAEIGLSIDTGAGLTQLILGNADVVDLDLPRGLLNLSGRDKSAAFLDNKTDEKFQNQTSSQIASILAQRRGLTPNVTATSTPAGRYYQIDHARLTNGISEWTLLNYLAQEEGFDVYVSGNTLNFLPSVQGGQPGLTITYTPPTPAAIQSGNFTDLQLHRSQTLAGDVVVKVMSWNMKQRAAFTATAKTSAKTANQAFGQTGAGALTGASQLYTYKIPGLTQQQAQNIANAKLEEISRHERVVDIEQPGETALQARQMVALTGTGTSFDQNYYIDRVNRTLSITGFRETVRMKNHSPESTVAA